MSRLQKIFAVMCLLCAMVGWLGASVKSENSAQLRDDWESFIDGLDVSQDYDIFEARLKGTGFFPLSTLRSEERARLKAEALANAETPTTQAPEFPDIIGSSTINGEFRVHLRLAEGEIATVKNGDILESGWQLKIVDSDRILAVYEGEEQEFKVTDYNAFEKQDDPKRAQGMREIDG